MAVGALNLSPFSCLVAVLVTLLTTVTNIWQEHLKRWFHVTHNLRVQSTVAERCDRSIGWLVTLCLLSGRCSDRSIGWLVTSCLAVRKQREMNADAQLA